MIRAVVDPGVLVSAFIGRQGSVPDRIVRAFVRLARSSAATALVSGDHDLLKADVTDVDVLTPRAFTDHVDGS